MVDARIPDSSSPTILARAASAPVSAEQRASLPSGLELCYQTFGEPTGDPLLLVMGLGGPMTWWDEDLCRRLAGRGFFVVRYDNRDTGRSGRGHGRVDRGMLVRAFLGLPGSRREVPYGLVDLAEDAFGLLDHLGIEQAHVTGVSMGGMIVQTMALAHPERVASLVSIMSTTGRRTVGWQDPRLLPSLLAPRQRDREAYVEYSARFWQLIGSPAYRDRTSLEQGRAKAEVTWDRGISGSGILRQMLAILTQPDRTEALGGLRMPAAVVHGLADKMVHVSGGRTTAAAIPDADLLLVEGMGHDVPPALFGVLADRIRRTADRARPA